MDRACVELWVGLAQSKVSVTSRWAASSLTRRWETEASSRRHREGPREAGQTFRSLAPRGWLYCGGQHHPLGVQLQAAPAAEAVSRPSSLGSACAGGWARARAGSVRPVKSPVTRPWVRRPPPGSIEVRRPDGPSIPFWPWAQSRSRSGAPRIRASAWPLGQGAADGGKPASTAAFGRPSSVAACAVRDGALRDRHAGVRCPERVLRKSGSASSSGGSAVAPDWALACGEAPQGAQGRDSRQDGDRLVADQPVERSACGSASAPTGSSTAKSDGGRLVQRTEGTISRVMRQRRSPAGWPGRPAAPRRAHGRSCGRAVWPQALAPDLLAT